MERKGWSESFLRVRAASHCDLQGSWAREEQGAWMGKGRPWAAMETLKMARSDGGALTLLQPHSKGGGSSAGEGLGGTRHSWALCGKGK